MRASVKFFFTKKKKGRRKEQSLHCDNVMPCKSFDQKKKTKIVSLSETEKEAEEEFCED